MQHIPVFLASNDKYAPFVATTMASILVNTREFIDFYVLDSGISEKNRQKIRDTRQYFDNFDIRFISVDCDKEFKDFPAYTRLPRDTFSRFLVSRILPGCEKVIYSDIDVAFVDDIAKLYNEDLGDKIIGAVPNYIADAVQSTRSRLQLDEDDMPFIAGLLLLNCRRWNDENINERIRQVIADKNCPVAQDQDILIKIFVKDYLHLDKKYGVIPNLVPNFEQYKTQENVAVWHYAGDNEAKPWNNKKLSGGGNFWKSAQNTAYTSDIEKKHHCFWFHKIT